jgi:hypothetical protein
MIMQEELTVFRKATKPFVNSFQYDEATFHHVIARSMRLLRMPDKGRSWLVIGAALQSAITSKSQQSLGSFFVLGTRYLFTVPC